MQPQEYIESDGALPEYDQYAELPNAEAFPRRMLLTNDGGEAAGVDSSSFVPIEGIPGSDIVTTTESATALNQRKVARSRKRRILQLDERVQLRNTELAEMNANYLANMAVAWEHKMQLRAAREAKGNARFWVWGAGIGGVGAGVGTVSNLGSTSVRSPLATFCGEELQAAVLGVSLHDLAIGLTGKKRDREGEEQDEDSSEIEGRRVRSRDDGGSASRIDAGYRDDDAIMAGYDDVSDFQF